MPQIREEALLIVERFSQGKSIRERRLLLTLMEMFEDADFVIAPRTLLVVSTDAGPDQSLPVPRLQLRWEGEYCHYEMVILLGEHDTRRERNINDGDPDNSRYMAIPFGITHATGGAPDHLYSDGHNSIKVEPPYRDGMHAQWDAYQLKLPVYVVSGNYSTQLQAKPLPS